MEFSKEFCIPDAALFDQEKMYTNFYTVSYYDNLTIMFSCLHNYHHISGNLVMRCLPNGTWSGVEPVCQVNYYMEKFRLSAMIAVGSFIVPLLLLTLDFLFFVKKRRRRREVFVKRVLAPEQYERIQGQTCHMSSFTVREMIHTGRRGSEFHAASFISNLDIHHQMERSWRFGGTQAPSADTGKAWYEPTTSNKPDNTNGPSQFAIFGAGRHFAKLGKRLFD